MVAAGLTPTDPVRWWLAARRVEATRQQEGDTGGQIEVVDGEDSTALGGGSP
jgi:hypothetical protein